MRSDTNTVQPSPPPAGDQQASGVRRQQETAARRMSQELLLSLSCGVAMLTGFILSLLPVLPFYATAVYVVAYICGGLFALKDAAKAIRKGVFEIDFLMLVAAAGAAILDDWGEGALLLFLFSMGNALERQAMAKANRSIAALTALAPKTALLKVGDQVRTVDISILKPGDIIVVRPNSNIAADGIVIAGCSSVNQAPITGESMPVDKEPAPDPGISPTKAATLDDRHRVYAGTLNGNAALEIKITREAKDSTLARLVQLVNEAQTQRSPTQRFADKIEKYYVPAILVVVFLLCFAFLVLDEPFSKSFYRAMSVLVGASPCALAISTPAAVLSGVARAARAGVLVKGGRPLEDLGTLHALAFDKTGTLTEGRPRLTAVVPFENTDEQTLLAYVIAVESLSDHPLARAIVRDAEVKLGHPCSLTASGLTAFTGKGVCAIVDGASVYAGNLSLFKGTGQATLPPELVAQVADLEQAGNTTMVIQRNGQYLGIIAVMDTPRPEAKATLQALATMGIRKMIMLTGDNQRVADAVARAIGLKEAMGGLLPEQKVEAVEKLTRTCGKAAMVGDGVNDAPAMAKSTVGIAMGAAGSDVALETADIALLGDKLTLLPFAIRLSRKAKNIIRQNLVISMGMIAVLIPLTTFGVIPIGLAVLGHEGSTLVVVLNALRLLAFKAPGNSPPPQLSV